MMIPVVGEASRNRNPVTLLLEVWDGYDHLGTQLVSVLESQYALSDDLAIPSLGIVPRLKEAYVSASFAEGSL